MISGATRYRLASRVVKAAAGPFEFISRLRPATVTERVLRLDADLQQHLVDPDELDGHARDLLLGLAIGAAEQPGQRLRRRQAGDRRRPGAARAGQPGAWTTRRSRRGWAWWSSPTRWPSPRGWPPRCRQVSATLRTTFRVVLLDEYQDTSAAQAIMLRGLFSGRDAERGPRARR